MHRIVTLLPSATEIVFALGCGHQLVGRSHECDFPLSVRNLPALTEPKFNVEGMSAEIDQRVKQIVADALSVYRVDAAKLAELCPDIIVTQSQCEVCAVSESDVEAAVAQWIGSRPRIVSLAPYALADVFTDLQRVASALDVPQHGAELVRGLRARMETISSRASEFAIRSGIAPTVAFVEWMDPLMTGGNWMPELIAMAGGKNLFGRDGKHSPWLKFDDLIASDPDVILLSPCGFDIPRTMSEIGSLAADPRWQSLCAVRAGKVFAADGNQFFNRPGPRLAESLEILAEILHPGAFHFGHEGAGWRRV